MCIVTKAMAIQFIDGKCHIKKWKSHETALSGYYACVSLDLLLVSSGAGTHTHTHTHTHKHTDVRGQNDFKKPGVRGPQACVRLV